MGGDREMERERQGEQGALLGGSEKEKSKGERQGERGREEMEEVGLRSAPPTALSWVGAGVGTVYGRQFPV